MSGRRGKRKGERDGCRSPRRCVVVSRVLATLLVVAACQEERDVVPDRPAPSLVPLQEPVVDIGHPADGEGHVLNGVTDAVRLPSGFAVADCGASEVRFFDEAGRHVRTVGGSGDGPGEFFVLQRLFRVTSDSLAAVDSAAAPPCSSRRNCWSIHRRPAPNMSRGRERWAGSETATEPS